MVYKWAEMTPQKRDALMAEMMGIKIRQEVTPDGLKYFIDEEYSSHRYLEVRPYTRNIRDAWEALNRVKSVYDLVQIVFVENKWTCVLLKAIDDYGHAEFIGTSENECEAICISVLRACGVEIETEHDII